MRGLLGGGENLEFKGAPPGSGLGLGGKRVKGCWWSPPPTPLQLTWPCSGIIRPHPGIQTPLGPSPLTHPGSKAPTPLLPLLLSSVWCPQPPSCMLTRQQSPNSILQASHQYSGSKGLWASSPVFSNSGSPVKWVKPGPWPQRT